MLPIEAYCSHHTCNLFQSNQLQAGANGSDDYNFELDLATAKMQSLADCKKEKGPNQNLAKTKLYVNNLDPKFTDDGLKCVFQKFGNVMSAKHERDRDGCGKGFGFVCFQTQTEAEKAIR